MKITKELLKANGWVIETYPKHSAFANKPRVAEIQSETWYAQYDFGRDSLSIWLNTSPTDDIDTYSDIYIRVCDTAEKLVMAFAIAEIDYKLKY